jgi:SAM-dependent methyltransferase
VTSDSEPVEGEVDNRVCQNCALILNVSGVRNKEGEFYSSDYNLLADNFDAEFVYQTESGAAGINEEYCKAFLASANIPSVGRLLEVGCGKGLFLSRFQAQRPAWSLSAVEPSKNAQSFISKRMPNVRIYEGILSKSPYANEVFDVVVSIGVLEHVSHPLEFLSELRACVAKNGIVMIAIPDFALNPTDVIVFDHLTRFTPFSFRSIMQRVGFEVLAMDYGRRIPMWIVARRSEAIDLARNSTEVGIANGQIEAATRWVEKCFESYDALAESDADGIGIFGTGVLAIAATKYTSLTRNRIACFFDDNKLIQNSTRLGRPVLDLSQFKAIGVSDIGFSANPCYLDQMYKRLADTAGSAVRSWSLPSFA